MSEQEKEQQQPQVAEATAPAEAAAPLTAAQYAKVVDAKVVKWLNKVMPRKTIDGVALGGMGLLDPGQKAQFKDFLDKDDFVDSRDRLQSRVANWLEMLETSHDSSEAAEALDEKIAALQKLFTENQASAAKTIRPLEESYRMLDAFYSNAQLEAGDKVDAWIFNASAGNLMDPDDMTNFELLSREIQKEFRKFTMRKNYGLMVVPGWMGDIKKVDRLAKLANQNKLTVISDGPDMDSGERLLEYMEQDAFANMLGSDDFKRNMTLCSNYVLARDKHAFEEEEMFLPPSCHLAGAVYRNDVDPSVGIQQGSAGFTFGKLLNAEGTRFEVDRPLATNLMVKHGLNAVVDWDGYCRMMGDQNLCNIDGFNSYSRIRTEDWIVKNVLNFLNYQAFKNINNNNLVAWRKAIFKFLESITDRHGAKAITGFDIQVLANEAERRRGEVRVELSVEFQHVARYFNLRVKEKGQEKESEIEEKTA